MRKTFWFCCWVRVGWLYPGKTVKCFSWLFFWAGTWLFRAWHGARGPGYFCVSLVPALLFWKCLSHVLLSSFSLAVMYKQSLLLRCTWSFIFPLPDSSRPRPFTLLISAYSSDLSHSLLSFPPFFWVVSAFLNMYIVVQCCSIEGSGMMAIFCVNTVATSQMWPLSTWNVAGETEQLNFKFYFI